MLSVMTASVPREATLEEGILDLQEITISDIDVDREQLLVRVAEQVNTEGGEDALKSFNAAAKVKPSLATLEKGLFDLRVHVALAFAHDIV
jgi:hypothetical protein